MGEYIVLILCTYWCKEIENKHVKNPIIDFIVTPKGGSYKLLTL